MICHQKMFYQNTALWLEVWGDKKEFVLEMQYKSTVALGKIELWSIFHSTVVSIDNMDIRVRHIFLDFKVSRYIEGYSFLSIRGP